MFAYFVNAKGTNKFKIGKTHNLERRLQSMRTDSPFPIVLINYAEYHPGYLELEQELHDMLEAYNSHLEWYTMELKEVKIICNLLRDFDQLFHAQNHLARIELFNGIDAPLFESKGVCAQCQKVPIPINTNRKYCSRACQQAAYRERKGGVQFKNGTSQPLLFNGKA